MKKTKAISMDRHGILQKIGLSANGELIYTTLLEYTSLSPSDIVRKTGIHRPATYLAIDELLRIGLIQITPKGKNKQYSAKSPAVLENLFNEIEDEFNSEIFKLNTMYTTKGKRPIVSFTEGEKSIMAVFSDIVDSLKPNDTYYRYSPRLTVAREHLVPKDYRHKRNRKNLERFIISDKKSATGFTKSLGKSVRVIPDEYNVFDTDVSEVIYGNKVAFIDYNSNSVITIENEMIAEFQKKLFKVLWKGLEK